jgi:hypothetical protein
MWNDPPSFRFRIPLFDFRIVALSVYFVFAFTHLFSPFVCVFVLNLIRR